MKYEFDFPYEIKTCQACPFMSLYKGSTHCAFAPYGEHRSIRYGTCPLRVAGWHTETPTEEGDYYVAIRFGSAIKYEARKCWKIIDNQGNECMRFDGTNPVVAWQKITPFEPDKEN